MSTPEQQWTFEDVHDQARLEFRMLSEAIDAEEQLTCHARLSVALTRLRTLFEMKHGIPHTLYLPYSGLKSPQLDRRKLINHCSSPIDIKTQIMGVYSTTKDKELYRILPSSKSLFFQYTGLHFDAPESRVVDYVGAFMHGFIKQDVKGETEYWLCSIPLEGLEIVTPSYTITN